MQFVILLREEENEEEFDIGPPDSSDPSEYRYSWAGDDHLYIHILKRG